jgi:hypothetical protein
MRQSSSVTEQKYAAFIDDCHSQTTFDGQDMLRKHKVDGSLISTLASMGLVATVERGVYKWVGEFDLTPWNTAVIIDTHREKAKSYRAKREGRKEQTNLFTKQQKPSITEQQAVDFLKSIGGYEIYKVERKQV